MIREYVNILKSKGLTKNQIQVVLLQLAGYSNVQIADKRFTTVKSVKDIKRHARDKLELKKYEPTFLYFLKVFFPTLPNEIINYLENKPKLASGMPISIPEKSVPRQEKVPILSWGEANEKTYKKKK